MTAFDAKAVFAHEFGKAIEREQAKSGFALDNWFWSGRQKPETSVEWWQANGPELVQRYIDWYESHDDVTIWITPDGQPAIELELRVKFGDVEVVMAIDQVLKMGTALVVTDLKGSAKAPESSRQLGIYACGIELAYGVRPKYGAYFLPREDPPFQKPVELSGRQYQIPYFVREFAQFEQAVSKGIFLANPGRSCGRCSVAHACLANGGERAREFDSAHPHYGRKLSALAPR
jgi:putative RecB family exonuclease